MTKDLAMQGSCIAKVISIRNYPRDLNELEFQERLNQLAKRKKRN